MDGWSRFAGIIVLGVLAAGALVIMGLCARDGREAPPTVSAAFGVSVGAIAGLLTPQPREER